MKIRSRGCVALLCLLLALGASPFAQTKTASALASAPALAKVRIVNFGQISSTYFRGSQPRGTDFADLASAGIKTVIDLTSDDTDASEPALAKSAGLKLIKFPMTTHDVPSQADVAKFLGFVQDPANQPVYVHCVGGKHRTGVMTAIYRMTLDKWNATQAFSEMKHYGYGADFLHPEFKKFVFGYKPQDLLAEAGSTNTPTTQAAAVQ